MRTRIKICGVTRPEDAQTVAALGADAVGFVLWSASPRAVTHAVAAAIARALPPFVSRVGVFVDAAPADVSATVGEVGLDAVQLHGDESVERFAACGARVLKAVVLESEEDVARAVALPGEVTPLVDARDPVLRGGTGQVANWRWASALARQREIVLAGGLSADNVEQALRLVRPAGIDVSSGVESAPGVKDVRKLMALFEAVRAADRGAA